MGDPLGTPGAEGLLKPVNALNSVTSTHIAWFSYCAWHYFYYLFSILYYLVTFHLDFTALCCSCGQGTAPSVETQLACRESSLPPSAGKTGFDLPIVKLEKVSAAGVLQFITLTEKTRGFIVAALPHTV